MCNEPLGQNPVFLSSTNGKPMCKEPFSRSNDKTCNK
jgi:hypothetical protein